MSVRQNIGGLRSFVTAVRSMSDRLSTGAPYTTFNIADASFNSSTATPTANNVLITNVHLWGDTRYKVGK